MKTIKAIKKIKKEEEYQNKFRKLKIQSKIRECRIYSEFKTVAAARLLNNLSIPTKIKTERKTNRISSDLQTNLLYAKRKESFLSNDQITADYSSLMMFYFSQIIYFTQAYVSNFCKVNKKKM